MADNEKVQQSRVNIARGIMADFVTRTGITGEAAPVRYLWTDAFAVCNLLGLTGVTEEPEYLALARDLIDQVHDTLGRFSADDRRRGWISGLADQQGQLHPTAGGLRIGKPLPERAAGEPIDERLEWNRDGQYFHYLTKWAHALDVAGRWMDSAHFSAWSRELLETGCDRFTVTSPTGGLRMAWKMSVDLSRPLVPSMGQHDPLDGYIRCMQLRTGARAAGEKEGADAMAARATRLSGMIRRDALPTADPLGIGGLMMDAAVLAQLIDGDEVADDGLLDASLAAATAGLQHYQDLGEPEGAANRRLAFRELGLSIGLQCVPVIEKEMTARPRAFHEVSKLARRIDALAGFSATGRQIEDFWLTPGHRDTASWLDHEDINAVMLATSLVPDGFLLIH